MQRLEFILRRLLTSIFVLLGVSFITFFIARVVPNDAAAMYIGPKARQADIDRVTKQLGLDKSLPAQYVIYMQELLRGDLGTSIATKRPVLQELTGRLPLRSNYFVRHVHCRRRRRSVWRVERAITRQTSRCRRPRAFHRRRFDASFFSRTHPSNYFLSQS
ncbi:MAG: ABC transporter permease [Anaerolineales bacterium]